MMLRTHLAVAFLFIILFVEHVNNQIIFVGMVLLATIIPDLDNSFSSWGRHLIFRPLQWLVNHRGIIHSFTTAIALSIILSIFFPIASLGFFVGYSVHLICDSFTKEGIQPFWPLKQKSIGFIRSGGRIEDGLFIALILIDVLAMLFVWII